MRRKNDLLSIGDLSRLTGAGIKSLRYYERINVLKPAYIDPDSKYRYYTFDQTKVVEVILFCIELDIPLAEFAKFMEADGTMDFRKFFAEGRAVAAKKMNAIKKGLSFMDAMERQMDLTELHRTGEIYSRELPEKTFLVRPCGDSLENTNTLEIALEIVDAFMNLPHFEDLNDIWDYGVMCEFSPRGAMYYAFAEIPLEMEIENKRVIPGGTYLCRQDEDSQIEHADEIFKTHLKGRNSFLAIETHVLTGCHKINKPLSELRIRLDNVKCCDILRKTYASVSDTPTVPGHEAIFKF
ncbi:MAG: MerR family DNA-binding transcriptional regulator [Defluviitaleaceae bacterium]|nr:MerR family DNA-binding transcriptional regulator [Defluviitaleaceae bacterium]